MMYRTAFLLAVACAVSGADQLKQGFHDNVKVGDGDWTYDAYLPTGYDDHPTRQYPTLFLSSPGSNPDTKPWHSWADRRGMVVIAINSTNNDRAWPEMDRIQEATLTASTAAVRVHRVLRYSSGLSGGAWCSVRLAKHRPEAWAGVHLSGHSGNGDVAPKTCAIAMYAGHVDDIHPFKVQEGAATFYRSSGNPTRLIAHEGGHIYGDVNKDLTPLIDFLYFQTVVALPLLTNPERSAMVTVLGDDLKRIAALEKPQERRARCEEMASIPQLTASPLGKELAAVWIAAVQADASATTDVRDRHFALGTAVTDPLFAGAPKDARKAVQDDLRTVQKDKTLKDEVKALQALAKMQAAEADAGTNSAKLKQVAEGYQQIAEKMAGTKAGEIAAAKQKR